MHLYLFFDLNLGFIVYFTQILIDFVVMAKIILGEVSSCLIAKQCFLVHVHELLFNGEVVVSYCQHCYSIFQFFRERDVIRWFIGPLHR